MGARFAVKNVHDKHKSPVKNVQAGLAESRR